MQNPVAQVDQIRSAGTEIFVLAPLVKRDLGIERAFPGFASQGTGSDRRERGRAQRFVLDESKLELDDGRGVRVPLRHQV